MIKKSEVKNGVKVRVLDKRFGVSLNKSGLNVGDILVISVLESRAKEEGEGGFISAHRENSNDLFNFLPEDLEIVKS